MHPVWTDHKKVILRLSSWQVDDLKRKMLGVARKLGYGNLNFSTFIDTMRDDPSQQFKSRCADGSQWSTTLKLLYSWKGSVIIKICLFIFSFLKQHNFLQNIHLVLKLTTSWSRMSSHNHLTVAPESAIFVVVVGNSLNQLQHNLQ